jgi:LemA protein
MIILGLIGFFVILSAVLLAAYAIVLFNSLIRLRNENDRAWANIEVLLKQRHDQLPNLVECCKAYMQHERQTFEMVSQARSAYQGAGNVPEKAAADTLAAGAVSRLFALAEAYPDLKANQNFLQLQSQISELEEKIADRREFYNADVAIYNTRIAQFPQMFFANVMSMKPRDLFKVSQEESQAVQVKFA